MATFDLVCIGFCVLDTLVRPVDHLPSADHTTLAEEIKITAAGTAAAPAIIAARYGLNTRLIGCLGHDLIGRTLHQALSEEGINLQAMQHNPDLPTSATVLPIAANGNRPNIHAIGASLALNAPPTHEAIDTRFLHYGGAGLHPMFDGHHAAELLAHAKAAGATTSCDTINANPHMLEAIEPLLAHLDYFMPRIDEAQLISSSTTVQSAATFFLERGVGTCIFKDGARGSHIYTRDEHITIPALPVEVIDTTGCGDSFCGGFIAALAEGFDIHTACMFASATASLVASALGSQGAVTSFQSTLATMNEWLNTKDRQ